MAGIACTHVAMAGVRSTVFSGGADPFLFRGSEGRLVYVGRGPAYVVWSGIPSWVFNQFESSLLLDYGDSLLCSLS